MSPPPKPDVASDFAARWLALAGILALASILVGIPIAEPFGLPGVDTGMSARGFAEWAQSNRVVAANRSQGNWVRIRGVPPTKAAPSEVASTRDALRDIHRRGFRILVFDHAGGPKAWTSGVRAIPGQPGKLPLDLREAFRRALRLGETYGDLVDAWEIENEPELIYVPENAEHYVAYLKSCYLGLHDGIALSAKRRSVSYELGAASLELTATGSRFRPNSQLPAPSSQLRPSSVLRPPSSGLVLMAPLGLPPGEHLDRMLANELLSYTDGINLHYYGYAEDLTDFLQVSKAALSASSHELGAGSSHLRTPSSELLATSSHLPASSSKLEARSSPLAIRELPVFISEIGYGTLSGPAAETSAGRARQWRWFRSIFGQLRDAGVQASMAFYLPPYFEEGRKEFGLLMPHRFPIRAADLGPAGGESWTREIGRQLGDNFVTPALAWLGRSESEPIRPQPWSVPAAAASRVVIDFVADSSLRPHKSWQGYSLSGAEGAGGGELRIYNLSDQPVSGRLILTDNLALQEAADEILQLPPQSLRQIRVRVVQPPDDFRQHETRAVFVLDDKDAPSSVFVTGLYPDADAMQSRISQDFQVTPDSQTGNRSLITSLSRSTGEPALVSTGKWLVTCGVSVEEVGDIWRFRVERLPDEPSRPATAILPLPDGWPVNPEEFLLLATRLANAADTTRIRVPEPVSDPKLAGPQKEYLGAYWRGRNGSRYAMAPAITARPGWHQWLASAAHAPLWTYGRFALPVQLGKSEAAGLEIQFQPLYLPAVYEVQRPKLLVYRRKAP